MDSVVIRRNNSKSRSLSILLSFWIYTYALFYFVPLLIPSTTMLMYLWLVGIDLLVVFNSRYLSVRVAGFLIAYVLITMMNIVAVSYKYYVAIDSFSGLAVFLPALLIISSNQFDLKDFLEIWNKFAIMATILSPVAIILVQHKTIDYGVFTYLNLPNCIAFSYKIMSTEKKDRRKKIAFVLANINFLTILLFGGRMAAFASAFSIFIAYMFSSSVRAIKKFLIIVIVGGTGIEIINHINIVLPYIQAVLNKYNLNSRSFSLLVEQMQTGGTNLYLTRRNVIYDEILNYIKDRSGLPGGFGVSLNISNGQFYHPHNLFLQLAVMFGVIGGILLLLLIIYRVFKIKRTSLPFEYQFTLLVLIDYLVISFTGGSILNNFIAILGISMVFFYRNEQQKNIIN